MEMAMNSTKKEIRAFNRIRKREVELKLMNNDEADIQNENNVVNNNHVKRAKLLSRAVRAEREKRNFTNLVFMIDRLGGRAPNARDVASLLHFMLLGGGAGLDKPSWVRIEGRPLQTVLLRINCLEHNFNTVGLFIDEFFSKKWIQLDASVCDRHTFWKAISTVKLNTKMMIANEIRRTGVDPLANFRDSNMKLSLLMSLDEMARDTFSLGVKDDVYEGIVPTKSLYRRVHRDSPIYVIDCEMCLTSDRQSELTRFSMVDEYGRIVIDTFVKPLAPIIDYMTKYSGITPDMLAGVTTHLVDVQRAVRRILPADAILCGHTLASDLHALKMSHPYCIDLATQFHFAITHKKSKLQTLARIFLKEDIQNSTHGHCSVEDALATLRLLQLKFKHGLAFGNAHYGWSYYEWSTKDNDDSQIPLKNSAKLDNCFEEITTKKSEKCQKCNKLTRIECRKSNCLCLRSLQILFPENRAKMRDPAKDYSFFCVPCLATFEMETYIEKNTEPIYNSQSKTNEKSIKYFYNESNYNDLFDFKAAINVEPNIGRYVQIDEILNRQDQKSKEQRNFLAAINTPDEYFQTNSKCTLLDLSSKSGNNATNQDHLKIVENEVTSCLINYRAAVIEVDANTRGDIDVFVRAIVSASCVNSLMAIVLTSPSNAILYAKIKHCSI